MSANNYVEIIQIAKKMFVVYDSDIETENGFKIGWEITLEKAIEMAQRYLKENEVEYGIHFKLLKK
jgi:hypothetical protein